MNSYWGFKAHVGHRIEVVTYGPAAENVAIECIDCCEVLVDHDRPDGLKEEEAWTETGILSKTHPPRN